MLQVWCLGYAKLWTFLPCLKIQDRMRIFCIFSPWEARNPCQKHHAVLLGSGWCCMKSCGESWLMLWDVDLVLRSVLNQCSLKQNDTPQEETKGFNEPEMFMEHRCCFSLYYFLQTNKNPQSHKLPLQDIRRFWQGTKKLLMKTEFAAFCYFHSSLQSSV